MEEITAYKVNGRIYETKKEAVFEELKTKFEIKLNYPIEDFEELCFLVEDNMPNILELIQVIKERTRK